MVVVPADVLARYERFTCYNSPYPAHDRGCAIDLYPGEAVATHPGSGVRAPSPVAGEVRDTRTVRAPEKPYAAAHDHLLLIDVEAPTPAAGTVARILHVDPAVEPGDRVAVGDPLGTLVRSGYFAPWVANHLHLGFRPPDADPYRASGSLRLRPAVEVEPLAWDGTGTVVETGETYAVLDSPEHPAPGERWAGVAPSTAGVAAVLDGGLPHYECGGLLGGDDYEGPVGLAGGRVGHARSRDVAWDDPTVLADGRPITGLSLFLARDAGFGAKLICPDESFEEGETVSVSVATAPTDG